MDATSPPITPKTPPPHTLQNAVLQNFHAGTLLPPPPAPSGRRQRFLGPPPEQRSLRKYCQGNGCLEMRPGPMGHRPDHGVLAQQDAIAFAALEGIDRQIEGRRQLPL